MDRLCIKGIEEIYAVHQCNKRHIYWNTTAASWVEDFEDRSEFTTRAAAEQVARERGGMVEDRSWLLLGHNMYIGHQTMYFRSTCKGVGGSLSVEKATHLTLTGAAINQTPPYSNGRGWEIVHVRDAAEYAEVDDHYVDSEGVTQVRKLIVRLDN